MKNESGIVPLEYKVLVLPEQHNEKSEGGIHIPEQIREKEEMAETEGVLIDVGPDAFTTDDGQQWSTIPKVGSDVHFAKYAGVYIKGNDGMNYRLINDKDILAIRVRSEK